MDYCHKLAIELSGLPDFLPDVLNLIRSGSQSKYVVTDAEWEK